MSEGSVDRSHDPTHRNRIQGNRNRTNGHMTMKSISIKGIGCKSGGCVVKGIELTLGGLPDVLNGLGES